MKKLLGSLFPKHQSAQDLPASAQVARTTQQIATKSILSEKGLKLKRLWSQYTTRKTEKV